ncbi:MAG: FCD domain-containing protein, partial [Desulfobacteraceae bacterium]|nr:FCD domain-containing protein [Desulfobacteraceae bacterium]
NDLITLVPGGKLYIAGHQSSRASHTIYPKAVHRAFSKYMLQVNPNEDDFLFKSRKGSLPLTIQSASRLVKAWFERAGITGLAGVQSLQQTFERHFSAFNKIEDNKRQIHEIDQHSEAFSRPVAVSSTLDLVYSELLRALASAQIMPGEKIIPEKISQHLNVSRIPVREALARLEARGLVYSVKNRGTYASKLSLAAMRELLDIRLANEKIAARAAALNPPAQIIGQLEKIHAGYVAAWNDRKRGGRLFGINREFHFTIYQAANKPILLEMISFLWDRFSPYLFVFMDQKDVLSNREDILFHEAMIKGMKNADPEEVVHWLTEDINDTRRLLEKYFRLHQKSL